MEMRDEGLEELRQVVAALKRERDQMTRQIARMEAFLRSQSPRQDDTAV